MSIKNNYHVAIIGAGPAGISCAIYLLRAGVSCIVFEEKAPGGTLNKINKIENYPGYTEELGSILAFKMYSQIEELGAEIKSEKVVNIKDNNLGLNIITTTNNYNVNYAVIATGRVPKRLDLEDSYKYEGRGISYCSICDGSLYKDKNVAIIGGGNSAMESAQYLSDIANKVYIINRSKTLRASKKEQDIVKCKSNVEIIYNAKIKSFVDSSGKLKGIELDNGTKLDIEGIFVCIGQDVNNFFYDKINIKSDKLGILVDKDMKTSNPKVYAAGDSISKNVYQVVTAVSEGACAANSIIKELRSN